MIYSLPWGVPLHSYRVVQVVGVQWRQGSHLLVPTLQEAHCPFDPLSLILLHIIQVI